MVASLRSDSSASTIHNSSSPIPSSLNNKDEQNSIHSRLDQSSKETNGQSDHHSKQRPRESFGMRARSASLQKGVAVLKALARAPEEEEVDSGYEDEAGEVNVGSVPGVAANEEIAKKDEAEVRLTEEAKESGRMNREGLRKRNEQKEVERQLGNRTHSNTSIDSSTGKRKEKKKQILITEKPRKVFHSSIGFLVLYLYLWDINLSTIVRNLSIFLGIVITADVLRLNIAAFETIYEAVLGFLMRDSEKEKVNGVVWYLIGVITCLSLYPADVACVSVMILSWADTAASVFGRLFGPKTPALPSPPFAARKSTAGFVAAVIVASLTAALFWATPIAQIGKRPEGLSIHDEFGRAIFGTSHISGPLGNGWTGFKWGFRPSHPDIWLAKSSSGVLHNIKESVKVAGQSIRHSGQKDRSIPLPILCIGSGLVAGIAEGLELGGVDDNLSLPILSAVGIHALLVTWGWLSSYLS